MRSGAPSWRGRALVALALFALLMVAYQANSTVISEGDAVPSEVLPIALLTKHTFTVSPDDFPELFKWKSHPPFVEKDDFFFTSWKDRFGGRPASDWRFSSHLELNGPRYYIVKSPKRPGYVSTFGPVPGLVLLPFIAPFLARDPDLAAKLTARATIGKLCASMLVAGTAVLIFLIVERWLSRKRALLVAAIYGLATCAWAISSQALWQQTVDQFFLTLGAFFLLGRIERTSVAVCAGLSFGIATACRPTGAIVVLCVLVYLLVRERKSVVPFLLGVAPPVVAIASYNYAFFGNPLSFGQELVGHLVALQKTRSADLWQTPLWVGLSGLLVSPSRGLLVFSPVLGASFWGAARAFRDPKYRALRPLVVSAFVMMLLQCKWFDWWGGHAYGYRPWLDALPVLSLLLAPVLDSMVRSRARRVVFGGVVAWSVFVQVLGAMSYDRMWNLRRVYVFRVPGVTAPGSRLDEVDARRAARASGGTYLGPSFCDIDLIYCRYRLWSLRDNLILYQLTHFSETRAERRKATFTEPNPW